MSTHCLISAKIRGMVYGIYCHNDGYPDHIIPLLRDHYNTRDKIGTLLLLGYTSSISDTLEDCRPYCNGIDLSEEYNMNAPNVRPEFSISKEYPYEYYWDGEQWLYRNDKDYVLRPARDYVLPPVEE